MQPPRAAQRAKQGVECAGKQHHKPPQRTPFKNFRETGSFKPGITVMRGNKTFPPYNKTSFVVRCERPLLRIIRVSARQKVFREQGSTCTVFPRYQRSLRSLVSFDFIGCFPDSSKQPGGGGRGKMKGGLGDG